MKISTTYRKRFFCNRRKKFACLKKVIDNCYPHLLISTKVFQLLFIYLKVIFPNSGNLNLSHIKSLSTLSYIYPSSMILSVFKHVRDLLISSCCNSKYQSTFQLIFNQFILAAKNCRVASRPYPFTRFSAEARLNRKFCMAAEKFRDLIVSMVILASVPSSVSLASDLRFVRMSFVFPARFCGQKNNIKATHSIFP